MNNYLKRFSVVLLAVAACVCFGHAAPSVEPSPIYGHWVVKRLIPTSGISTGPGDLNRWIGSRVSYSASEARFESHAMKNPRYKVRRVSADDFLRDSKFPLDEIGIHSRSVTEIDLVDLQGRDTVVKGPGSLVFVRSKDVLVTVWDGGYFEMVRIK